MSIRAVHALPALSVAVLATATFTPHAPKPQAFEKIVLPFIKKHCGSCHGADSPVAGLNLVQFGTETSARLSPEIWGKVAKKLEAGEMPPQGMPRPPADQVEAVLAWIRGAFPARAPGRTTLRRLNRAEYVNTVRDLVGIEFEGAEDFPSDDVGYGFDNIGDVLTLSPLLFEKYFHAAQEIARRAVPIPGARLDVGPLKVNGSGNSLGGAVSLYSLGEAAIEVDIAAPGDYSVMVKVAGKQAGPDVCRASLNVDGRSVASFEVPEVESQPGRRSFALRLEKGKRSIGVAFVNDFYQPNHPDPKQRDRNLMVYDVEVTGPKSIDTLSLSPAIRKLLFRPVRTPEDVRLILGKFAERAYRRPVTKDELDRLTKVTSQAGKAGDPLERSVLLGVVACLTSPNFLFRPEIDPIGASNKRELNDWELASRLSYFLWSSMPDDELFQAARSGSLTKPQGLQGQVSRMLRNPKSRALAENFATQWLTLRKLESARPDPKLFPDFDGQMRADMATETILFFDNLVRSQGSILDLLNGKYTFVNAKLAKVYGLPNVEGDKFRKVSLANSPRAGVITQPGVLTVTSNPTRTSPVKRGKWLLEAMLGAPPPPPPPGVGSLAEDQGATQPKTLRERLDRHRSNPSCASCHDRIDPLGFGLENFDPVGRWRTQVQGVPIDAGGKLPDGTTFSGPVELTAILMKQKRQFVRNLASQMLTYGLGRGVEFYDDPAIDSIVRQTESANHKMPAMIQAIVSSEPFRFRSPSGRTP